MKKIIIILIATLVMIAHGTKVIVKTEYPKHFELTAQSGCKIVIDMKDGKVTGIKAITKSGVHCLVPKYILDELEIKKVDLNTVRIITPYGEDEGTFDILFEGKSFLNFLHDQQGDMTHYFTFYKGKYYEGLPDSDIKTNKMDRVIDHIKESPMESLKN